MTETVDGSTSRAQSGRARARKAKGLSIERVYTTEGVHPYDAVTWERRDVVQTNWKTGETVFEQRGVEFPDFWSVNASTIVTTKYFRGAVGSPEREQSLRQLLDRVVLTYTKAGKEHGYFATDADAEVFEHELTHMLLHQVFSFNSPVWFNVGTSSPQQVSACFILAVDDSMDSILNWYREEGLIFKGGSGAGLNLSRIRSSKELLRSSGGTASGPVSFMRGADASAGTIKSGGATRRAAKMVVLDVDHPDIVEFVETKEREEEKIRVLRDAGFDMDLGGEDITSVQYQNANNSIRVDDAFMRAVEEGTSYGLRARTSGEVIEEIDAKELWGKVAKAAWACADPGIQYDSTINDWHTTPETGRITASNPCSEYMHLDNSSCNLASLNLLKFLSEDGTTFDVERFVKSVELIITAMDISICFADFPTEAIGETTKAYRQLGIGYANLGAMLMASGLAYDSDGGRALAASITSLMTGVSYRRSAELAGVVGAYDGYQQNAAPHTRVMRKHLAANDDIRTMHSMDIAVQREATKQWADNLKIGEKNGWRNAQASVLAPTGTIGFMMDCDTTGIEPDFSLVKFKKLVGGGSMQVVNQTVPVALKKLGYTGETIEAIMEYIAEKGHVVDAPGLKTEHYEVFDCAVGDRAIKPMGHVRMMAAAQPFLSGAISKTVNMPETSTVEEIADVYFQGWKLGLKALAVYRDNCKVGQPLSSQKSQDDKTSASATAEATPEVKTVVVEKPIRRRLPKSRQSITTSFSVGPEARQAGLDPGRRDGRLLDRGLDRPAVRRAAGDVRAEVHEPQVRAGGSDGRLRRPHGAVDHGLRLPPSGAGLHRLRDAVGAGHPLGRGASALPRHGQPPADQQGFDGCRACRDPAGDPEGGRDRRGRDHRRGPRGRLRGAGSGRHGQARPEGGAHVGRAPRGHHRLRRRLAPVHDLRHQDASRRLLPRLRGLRQHQRLQLTVFRIPGGYRAMGSVPARSCLQPFGGGEAKTFHVNAPPSAGSGVSPSLESARNERRGAPRRAGHRGSSEV